MNIISVVLDKQISLKKVILLVVATAFLFLLIGHAISYKKYYYMGFDDANGWWIRKKELYWDSVEILKKRLKEKCEQI